MGLTVVDYVVLRLQSPLTTESDSTVTLTPAAPYDVVPQGFYWRMTSQAIDVISGGATIAAATFCRIFDRDPTSAYPLPVLGTIAGSQDWNDQCQLVIQAGDGVWVQWTGVPAACSCRARLQFEVVTVTPDDDGAPSLAPGSATAGSRPIMG